MNNFNFDDLLTQLELQLIQAESQVDMLRKQIDKIKSDKLAPKKAN